jgi:hypothetical protein
MRELFYRFLGATYGRYCTRRWIKLAKKYAGPSPTGPYPTGPAATGPSVKRYAGTVALSLLLAGSAFPADPATSPTPQPPAPTKMSNEDKYHGQALEERLNTFNAQSQALTVQYQSLQSSAKAVGEEHGTLKEKVCAAAKVPLEECNADFTSGTVSKLLLAKPAPPPPSPTK